MILNLAGKAGLSADQLYFNIETMGNVSAASIPIAVYDAVREGVISREPGRSNRAPRHATAQGMGSHHWIYLYRAIGSASLDRTHPNHLVNKAKAPERAVLRQGSVIL